MWHRALTCVCLEAADASDWQVVIEVLMEKDNERITSYISLREARYEDTSCCASWEKRRGEQQKEGRLTTSLENLSCSKYAW